MNYFWQPCHPDWHVTLHHIWESTIPVLFKHKSSNLNLRFNVGWDTLDIRPDTLDQCVIFVFIFRTTSCLTNQYLPCCWHLVWPVTGPMLVESGITRLRISWSGWMRRITLESSPCRKVETWKLSLRDSAQDLRRYMHITHQGVLRSRSPSGHQYAGKIIFNHDRLKNRVRISHRSPIMDMKYYPWDQISDSLF